MLTVHQERNLFYLHYAYSAPREKFILLALCLQCTKREYYSFMLVTSDERFVSVRKARDGQNLKNGTKPASGL